MGSSIKYEVANHTSAHGTISDRAVLGLAPSVAYVHIVEHTNITIALYKSENVKLPRGSMETI